MAKKTGWTADEVRAAEAAGVIAELTEPHAQAASYNPTTHQVEVKLTNGVGLSVPVPLLQGLSKAKPAELAEIIVLPHGTAIHFPRLNADFTIPGLVSGIFGSAAWMDELRRQGHREATSKGGAARTAAKLAAARENGKKGGRPRKKVAAS